MANVEVWKDRIYAVECPRCGSTEVSESCATALESTTCPSCERTEGVTRTHTGKTGYWYWYCWPGCLPDSDEHGPYESAADARANAEHDEDTDEDSE